MKISIPKENRIGETRVAASPEVVKKFVSMGFDVTIQSDAGLESGFTDEIFKSVGASISSDTKSTLANADIIFKIQRLMTSNDELDETSMCKKRCDSYFAYVSIIFKKRYRAICKSFNYNICNGFNA